jgi:hypothetical protein
MKIHKAPMVLSLVFAWSLIAHADTSDRYTELDSAITPNVKAFIEAPSQKGFDEIVPVAKEMIELDSSDVRGYAYLSKIYMNAGGCVLEKKEALQKAIDVVDQYQKREDRTVDLTSLRETLLFMIQEVENKEKMDRKTQRMLDDMNPPPVIASVREIVRRYIETSNNDPNAGDLLDQAIAILNDEIQKNPTSSASYSEIAKIYSMKQDYTNTYVMWRIASQIGDQDDPAIQTLASNLYIKALEYERDTDISESNAGRNTALYFIWLNRKTLANSLPEDVKLRLDNLVAHAKDNK